MTDLENLKQMSLHDTPVNSLALDFKRRQLVVCLVMYNEDSRSYDELRLDFQGIDNLNLTALALNTNGFEELEIYSHTVTETDKGRTIEFQLLTGRGQRGATWSFAFQGVSLATS